MYTVTVLPDNLTISAMAGANLLEVLRATNLAPDAPCGGKGTCGKCRVMIDGQEVLSCQIGIDRNLTVTLKRKSELNILHAGVEADARMDPMKEGNLIAFDIGTTSVVCFLLDGQTGKEMASASMLNPQTVFGADVISRIQSTLGGTLEQQRDVIRGGMTKLIKKVCEETNTDPKQVGVVSVVGNPCMQQLLLGIDPRNLAGVPFAPVLTEAKAVDCSTILLICENAKLLIVPDLSGYIGADTMGCVLSTRMYESNEVTLMVDIGTNGEMVLGNQERMIACSTAAGPALEGANIHFGMRGTEGAIDHVWIENGEIRCSVIGGGEAKGICGSGLIDAIAVLLELKKLNKRGKMTSDGEVDGQKVIYLRDAVYLTQDDVRQVQMAKGAIYAGIALMARQLGIEIGGIQKVLLAGAFGNYLNPASACRIGLLPEELLERIIPVGNAAGSGSKLLACDKTVLPLSQKLTEQIEFLELASLPEFSRTFAKSMNFRE